MLGNNYPESQEQCLIVLPDALEDDDNENRWAAFQLGKVLFNDSMGKEILEKYVDVSLFFFALIFLFLRII